MFFGTQARILMTEWKGLAKCIMDHSTPVKDRPVNPLEDLENFDIENLESINFSTADDLPNILAEKNIKVALQGPYGAMIQQKMAAYAKIARLRLEIHLSKEEIFKGKRAILAEEQKIPVKKIEKFNFTQLDEIQYSLDEAVVQHNTEWNEFIEVWTNQLIDYLVKSQLSMTDREVKDLQDEELITDILPRFHEIGMKLPRKDYPKMTFSDYLYLKAMLITQSALSRQHLEHTDAQVQKKLQGFQAELAQMQEQEQKVLQIQQELTDLIVSPLD